MDTEIEGFILTSSSFDLANSQVLKFYGQSEEGSFLVTVDQFQNYFFKESKEPTSFQSLDGVWGEKVFCRNQADLKSKRKECEEQGLKTFEADIKAVERYLMDKGFYAQVSIKGKSTKKDGLLCFLNPEIKKSHYYPCCKIMSFDIETGRDGRLLSLAYSFRSKNYNEDKTIVLGEGTKTEDVDY